MLSDKALEDLHQLALGRVERAANSVGQLLDNNRQRFDMLILLTTAMAVNAAELLHQHSKMDEGECMAHVLAHIAAETGLRTTVLSQQEAEQYGLKI